jgi:ABC-type microcin C transport system duplicated ATPase subunit YejF
MQVRQARTTFHAGGSTRRALTDVSFSVQPGERVALAGTADGVVTHLRHRNAPTIRRC